jgi:hypothetical protein
MWFNLWLLCFPARAGGPQRNGFLLVCLSWKAGPRTFYLVQETRLAEAKLILIIICAFYLWTLVLVCLSSLNGKQDPERFLWLKCVQETRLTSWSETDLDYSYLVGGGGGSEDEVPREVAPREAKNMVCSMGSRAEEQQQREECDGRHSC